MSRLLAAEALLDLGMVDRAWTRLQDLSGALDVAPAVQRATARMYVLRGWPEKARPLLDALAVDGAADSALAALVHEASAPPVALPAAEPAPEASVAEALDVAHRWLCGGAVLRAQRLLERLHREHPDHLGVGDRLWALRGDYELAPSRIRALVDTLVPAAVPAASDAVAPPIHAAPHRPSSAVPPSLFPAGTDPGEDVEDASETTQATRLDDLAAAAAAADDFDEDTQVLRVVAASELPGAPEMPRGGPQQAAVEGEDDVVVQFLPAAGHQPSPEIRAPLPLPPPVPKKKRKRAAPQAEVATPTGAPVGPPTGEGGAGTPPAPPSVAQPIVVSEAEAAPARPIALLVVGAVMLLAGAALLLYSAG